VQTLVFAAFTSLLFMNLTPDVVGMGDRVGVLFLVTTNMGFSVLAGMINSFPPIKAVYIRDQASGSYSPFWFFVAKSIADFPLQLITAFLQCVIIYWSVDFVPKASLFFGYFGTLLFVQQVVVGLGWILSAASPNSMVSSALLPVIMTPMLLAGGLLASSDRLSPYWDWLQRISFLRQGFVVLAHQEFGNLGDISCDPGKYNCADQPKNGYEAMQAYGLLNKQDQDYIAFLCLLAEWVVFRIFALFALWRAGRAKE
jgi:ABC-type multidrug transport system permease subunit